MSTSSLCQVEAQPRMPQCSSIPQASGSADEASNMNLSELLIIRHGERADQIRSHPWRHTQKARPKDPPLTTRGKYQAHMVGRRLRLSGVKAKVIYSSPLQRCLETACEIAHELQLPVKVVVPLAKPCSYWRKCEARGIAPQFAAPEEAEKILQELHNDVELIGFQPDNGSTSRETMEKLVAQSKFEQMDEAYVQTIIVSHCESQKEMARVTGLKETIEAPYCGVAVFELQGGASEVNWSLVRTPKARKRPPSTG